MSAETMIDMCAAPHAEGGVTFPAPWTARAFGIVRKLSNAGVFTLSEWSQQLGRELALNQHLFSSEMSEELAYYRCWVNALEAQLQSKGVLSDSRLESAMAAAVADWPDPDHHAHREPVAVSPAQI